MDGWGERLDDALRRRRVPKLYALAVEIGVDESAISRWRKGHPISLPNAVALCRWLVLGRGTMDGHRAKPTEVLIAAAAFESLAEREAAIIRDVLRALADVADRETSKTFRR
jgi:hypothetical protein